MNVNNMRIFRPSVNFFDKSNKRGDKLYSAVNPSFKKWCEKHLKYYPPDFAQCYRCFKEGKNE